MGWNFSLYFPSFWPITFKFDYVLLWTIICALRSLFFQILSLYRSFFESLKKIFLIRWKSASIFEIPKNELLQAYIIHLKEWQIPIWKRLFKNSWSTMRNTEPPRKIKIKASTSAFHHTRGFYKWAMGEYKRKTSDVKKLSKNYWQTISVKSLLDLYQRCATLLRGEARGYGCWLAGLEYRVGPSRPCLPKWNPV